MSFRLKEGLRVSLRLSGIDADEVTLTASPISDQLMDVLDGQRPLRRRSGALTSVTHYIK
jgi:hypothetical protein